MPDEPIKQTKPQMKRIDGPPKPPTKITLDLDELEPRLYLKPRLSTSVGMLLGGCLLAWFGIRAVLFLGGYPGLLPGVFGVLGVLWALIGLLTLARRSQLTIIIDEAGIEFPVFRLYQRHARRVRIPREDITAVSKHESLNGR